MTTEEVIQQFIQAIGDETWTIDKVTAFFEDKGIALCEIRGALFSTPGIHNLDDRVWYRKEIVKMPPNQPH